MTETLIRPADPHDLAAYFGGETGDEPASRLAPAIAAGRVGVNPDDPSVTIQLEHPGVAGFDAITVRPVRLREALRIRKQVMADYRTAQKAVARLSNRSVHEIRRMAVEDFIVVVSALDAMLRRRMEVKK